MRDFLFDYFGRRPDEELTQGGNSGGFGTDPAKRRGAVKDRWGPRRLFPYDEPGTMIPGRPPPFERGGPQYESSPQQLDARTVVRPDYLKAAQTASLGAPLAARELGPVQTGRAGPGPWPGERAAPGGGMAIPGGLPGAAGAPAPPGRTPTAGMAMPQVGGDGQPQRGAMTPAGAMPDLLGRAASGVGDFLGGIGRGVGNWMGTPVRNSGLTRGDLVFDALGNIGQGLSTTGNIGQGLALAREGQRELFKTAGKEREDEEERQYRRLEMAYKQKKLEQEVEPKSHVLSAGGMLVGPNGEVIAQAPTAAQKTPTSIEAALFSDSPEIRARAEELRDAAAKIKGQPTEYQQQDLALRREKLKAEIAKASRPESGTGKAPGLTDMEKAVKYRDSLPPDHPDRPAADAYVRKVAGLTAATGGTTAATGGKPIPAEMVGKAASINTAAQDVAELEKYYFGEGGLETGSLENWKAAKANVPGTGQPMMATEGGGARARMDNAIDAIIRLRTGAGLNALEPEQYRGMYMPGSTDTDETAKIKLGMLKRDLAEAKRLFDRISGDKAAPAEGAADDLTSYPEPAENEGMRDYANRIAASHQLPPEKAAAIARKKYEE